MIFYYKINDVNFYHEINSIGQKLEKVVEKATLFCKLIDFLLFFDQKGFNFKKSLKYL